ncbi:MAG: metal-dependent phosphohydrolase, partial [Planctomycetota bacterium]
PRSFDLNRVLHYSQFTDCGLTLHERGMPALVHFLSMKAELFRSVYFHRTVRAIDLHLADLFARSFKYLFPGDPRTHLDEYLEFTEFSLLSRVRDWRHSKNPELQQLGEAWRTWLDRRVPWIMVCQRNLSFGDGQAEGSSIFSSPQVFRASLREQLPDELKEIEFEVDLARHIHRPNTRGAAAGMNFYFDAASGQSRPLSMHGLYQRLPISHTIARVYTRDGNHKTVFSSVLDQLLGAASKDDLTNM